MSDDTEDKLKKELVNIIENRANIIEQFIQFWLAANVPSEQLSPKIFENIVLVEKIDGSTCKYWIEFRDIEH